MELRGYIEGAVLVVVMWFVFQDIVQPILVGIDPIFADQSVRRVRGHPQTPAQVAGLATFFVGAFTYYSGRYVLSEGLTSYCKGIRALLSLPVFLFVPNEYIPEWFVSDDVDLNDWK